MLIITTNAQLHVRAVIELDGHALKMLNHLVSFNMTHTVLEHVTRQYGRDELEQLFGRIREQTSHVVAAVHTAEQAYYRAQQKNSDRLP
jgi:hypothetical protein